MCNRRYKNTPEWMTYKRICEMEDRREAKSNEDSVFVIRYACKAIGETAEPYLKNDYTRFDPWN